MSDLAEQANAMREEAVREKRNNQERQRYYSAKSRAKEKAKNGTPKATRAMNCGNIRKEHEMQSKKKRAPPATTLRAPA